MRGGGGVSGEKANTKKGAMKLDRRDLERKTLEVLRANRNTRSFIRSRAEFEKKPGVWLHECGSGGAEAQA